MGGGGAGRTAIIEMSEVVKVKRHEEQEESETEQTDQISEPLAEVREKRIRVTSIVKRPAIFFSGACSDTAGLWTNDLDY